MVGKVCVNWLNKLSDILGELIRGDNGKYESDNILLLNHAIERRMINLGGCPIDPKIIYPHTNSILYNDIINKMNEGGFECVSSIEDMVLLVDEDYEVKIVCKIFTGLKGKGYGWSELDKVIECGSVLLINYITSIYEYYTCESLNTFYSHLSINFFFTVHLIQSRLLHLIYLTTKNLVIIEVISNISNSDQLLKFMMMNESSNYSMNISILEILHHLDYPDQQSPTDPLFTDYDFIN
jgi:hypothetical protein